jgi:hypothetical protein
MATTVAAPTVYRVTSRVAPVRIRGSGGPTVTYCYRNPDGSLGTTTDVNAIPVGAERERIVSG